MRADLHLSFSKFYLKLFFLVCLVTKKQTHTLNKQHKYYYKHRGYSHTLIKRFLIYKFMLALTHT